MKKEIKKEQQTSEIEKLVGEIKATVEHDREIYISKCRKMFGEQKHSDGSPYTDAEIEGIVNVFMLGFDEGVVIGGIHGMNIGTKKMLDAARGKNNGIDVSRPKLII